MHFLGDFGQKKCFFYFGSNTVFLGQEVHYYMVYYMVYCKLYRIPFANLQLSANLMHLSRKWQIRSWRKFQRPFLCSLKGCQILPPWFCTKEPNVSKKLPSLKSFAPSKMTFKTIWNMELGFWGRKQTLLIKAVGLKCILDLTLCPMVKAGKGLVLLSITSD